MNNLWRDSTRRLDVVHRIGAVVFGLGLWVFGGLGLADGLPLFSTAGQSVLGLSSNGLLSWVSLVVGAVLIAGGIHGGRTASTVLTVVGAAFLLSGVVNVLVLDGPLNLLAFRMSNVVFSLVSGGLLLILGSYGRFTGRLPEDNPYADGSRTTDADGVPEPVRIEDLATSRAAVEMAEAERADARHAAGPEQRSALDAVRGSRRPEDRLRGWREEHAD
ncbi:DUF4383 domain-containing protein [Pseudonocardia oceani]|uniref:DUF4383 domain-containing protein n=1 Tax=Pseudonocardia oceani TaxID=2792013 RepID=A0ABS6UEN5_9PSEU|nr:DUF4383 domain-containing protein [Pseudonocardia oceani]MBW0092812.1 DUF4383 domain-containing protein [Pseudonocardia oceani]MBW0112282.1 DUF4383 domain-containing protein [Pseudonocardia oceani]MBW0125571.1 DUF4383 domain-containing protein [Pseudonocardia oceani]MBW0130686.1 DUF4383 domain-containing protein [Pseudonocardia oceani]